MKPYPKFGIMIATSTIVMYILMYLNTMEFAHVYFSETRAYMALIMGASMGLVMFAFMANMYPNKKANIAILASCVLVFFLSLWLVRSQKTVGDVSWMKAMIPHHSIAILTSERANLKDPQVKDLAGRIIEAQRKEIAEMQAMIERLEGH